MVQATVYAVRLGVDAASRLFFLKYAKTSWLEASAASAFQSAFNAATALSAVKGSGAMTPTKSPSCTTFTPGMASAAELSSDARVAPNDGGYSTRSEEHTSELQSLRHLVCRL